MDLLKSKSDAFTMFKQFKTMVELQLGYPLKALQTDLGVGGNLDISLLILMIVASLIDYFAHTHPSPKW
jgi:hypothetical protein